MSQMRKFQLGAALWGVLIGLGLALAIAACASGGSRSPVASGPMGDLDRRKQEIQDRWNDIRQDRLDNGMSADPLLDLRRPDIIQNSVAKIRQCPTDDTPSKTDVCDDVCNLKDKICENAETICRIAKDLGDDDWARGKCNSAKASCKEATQKCCGCLADEKSAIDKADAETAGAGTGDAVH